MPQTTRILDDGLDAAIESGAVVVTVNQRLARVLAGAYDERRQSSGRRAWTSADVLPLESWLQRCWREAWPARQILSSVQAQSLWEEVVSEDSGRQGLDLLREDAAAELAMRANELVHDYGLPDCGSAEVTPEYETFTRWRRAFREHCLDGGWLDPAELVGTVIEIVNEGEISLPQRLILAGFDELTPAAERLRSALSSRGIRVEDWAPVPVPEPLCDGIRAVDPAEEATIVATRICATYEPGLAIGVVVPELEKYRSLFERTFTAELAPAAVLPGSEVPEIFNFSLGTMLGDEPAVVTALTLLRALLAPLPWETAAAVLHSPFFGDAESEWKERAQLEVELRSWGLTAIPIERLLAAAEKKNARTTTIRLRALETASHEVSGNRRSPSRWADFFSRSLTSAGWPGERKRNSREFQSVTAWHEALADLSSLDAQLGSIEAAAAVTRLDRLCRRIFQPESRTVAPIQVLGLLETAGLQFDRLWVTGMHEQALPRPPRPNPFLPALLQRRHGVPHSAASVELDFARKLLGRLRQSAFHVSFLAPATVQGQPVRPSPLVIEIPPEAAAERANGSRSLLLAVHGSAALEISDDEPPPRVSAAERRTLRGGTAILADQSNCPFRAFALHRLRATALDEPEEQITPLEWGLAVHRALDLFWARITGSPALRALDTQALSELLDRVAAEALTIYREKLSGRLSEIHRARLRAALHEWVEVELGREPPFEVIAREHSTEIEIGGIALRTRLDRIDRLGDGRHVVIDYKTGRPKKSDWWTARPVDPQLPIYSQIRDSVLPRVDGIAYAQIRPGESRFVGIAASEGALPAIGAFAESRDARKLEIADWDALLARWRLILENIAAAFLAGNADVDPLRRGGWPPETCKHCPLPSLCRVNDLRLEAGSEITAEEEEA